MIFYIKIHLELYNNQQILFQTIFLLKLTKFHILLFNNLKLIQDLHLFIVLYIKIKLNGKEKFLLKVTLKILI